jgi:regulator of RNase E activity RraB
MLCGRITTQGRREFYFYAKTESDFAKAVEGALAAFKEYKFDLGSQEDPLWGHYLGVLYPSPEDLERIKNGKVLDVLREKGDVLSTPRDVQHWIYFRSHESRSLFRRAAIDSGFEVMFESDSSKTTLPFGISVMRKQSVDREQIDASVIELFRLAQQYEGDYDGWETPVVTE